MSPLVFLIASLVGLSLSTPLDDYVNKPDPTYSYHDTGKVIQLLGAKGYILNMTSQTWLTAAEVDRPVWWHSLVVIVPDKVNHSTYSFLWITGGHNDDGYPTDPTSEDLLLTTAVAISTGTITVSLFQIPSEPLRFTSDPRHERRSEDGIIAFTWAKFLNDSSLTGWPLRLPMTKACVRAMDTVQDFTAKKGWANISNWLVAGASKRGWTTWTVAAVDKRVKGMAPIVMDLADMKANMHHFWRALGGWTFAFNDYYDMNLTANIDHPNMQKLADIVDPLTYFDRLTMPKLIINSADDEFFMIDDDHFWWDRLPGEKHRLLAQNAEHSTITAIPEVLSATIAFCTAIVENRPRPEFSWVLDNDKGKITVNTLPQYQPTRVTLRWAHTISTTRRDFRWVTGQTDGKCPTGTIPVQSNCFQPIFWAAQNLTESQPGIYEASRPTPTSGWTAFFVEVYFQSHTFVEYRFTTQAAIVPNTFPFPECSGAGCRGTLV